MSHQDLVPAIQDALILISDFSYRLATFAWAGYYRTRGDQCQALSLYVPHMAGNCQQSSYTGESYSPENAVPFLQQQPCLLRIPA